MIRTALLAALLAAPAAAGTLEGRVVTLHTMTWDDPAAPYVNAKGQTVQVGDGVEFGLEPEGLTGGLDVVPVEVEIHPQRVELTYPATSFEGEFYVATFNGYVLKFETECALFAGWEIDDAATTLSVTDADVFTDKGALYINVSGRRFAPGETLAIDLDVTDCPMS